MQDYLKIKNTDNVAVALRDLPVNTEVLPSEGTSSVRTLEEIPAGHKVALTDIRKGEKVIKYGSPIGFASRDISAGERVHVHNLRTGLGDNLEYTYDPVPAPEMPEYSGTFKGFVRNDGSVGIRNDIWIIPTVGCVGSTAAAIANMSKRYLKGSVSDVIAFSHPYGCSQMGEDQENTRRILCDLITHPNAGGVLVLSLGCENSNLDVIRPMLGDADLAGIRFLVCQESEDEIEEGCGLVRELIERASAFEREDVPVSKLRVGLKCGGSDGLSGITANPLVGLFSDRLISYGGTTILTEVPEMFGAETGLMNRCKTPELFDETVKMINDFKDYFRAAGQTIYENPSPGNKKGGISTLEDKSLGCTQKSGTAQVSGVLAYGDKVQNSGLNLLSAPGNDLVAATALAAAGAQIVLFTTGRGTPFASPVPTLKISSNSALASRKKTWIDFDAGVLTEDGHSFESEAQALFDLVIAVAEGRKVRSEEAGFHDMAIFKQGVTL